MALVKIKIVANDRKVGAMVKALAVEVSGFNAVRGTKKDFLRENGFYEFNFPNNNKAEEFKQAVATYLPKSLAFVQ